MAARERNGLDVVFGAYEEKRHSTWRNIGSWFTNRMTGRRLPRAAVAIDRRGIADSIEGRIERSGGEVSISSTEGRARRSAHGAESGPWTIRVYLVDDHGLFRSGVRAEAARRCRGRGRRRHGPRRDRRHRRDRARRGGARRASSRWRRWAAVIEASGGGADTRFLALSVSDAADDVIAVIRAGARGYVTKTIAPSDLSDAIRRVYDGDAVFSPRLAGSCSTPSRGAAASEIDPELDQLTPREREVLRFIARGYAYKEAGRELHISMRTVETHVSSVLRKLHSRVATSSPAGRATVDWCSRSRGSLSPARPGARMPAGSNEALETPVYVGRGDRGVAEPPGPRIAGAMPPAPRPSRASRRAPRRSMRDPREADGGEGGISSRPASVGPLRGTSAASTIVPLTGQVHQGSDGNGNGLPSSSAVRLWGESSHHGGELSTSLDQPSSRTSTPRESRARRP